MFDRRRRSRTVGQSIVDVEDTSLIVQDQEGWCMFDHVCLIVEDDLLHNTSTIKHIFVFDQKTYQQLNIWQSNISTTKHMMEDQEGWCMFDHVCNSVEDDLFHNISTIKHIFVFDNQTYQQQNIWWKTKRDDICMMVEDQDHRLPQTEELWRMFDRQRPKPWTPPDWESESFIPSERWGAGVETPKIVRGEIRGWGRVPFNEPYVDLHPFMYDRWRRRSSSPANCWCRRYIFDRPRPRGMMYVWSCM